MTLMLQFDLLNDTEYLAELMPTQNNILGKLALGCGNWAEHSQGLSHPWPSDFIHTF